MNTENMFFCEWLRDAGKKLQFSGEIGMFQEKREDPYSIIAALCTDTSHRTLAGGTHYGLLESDWPNFDDAVDHIAFKAMDMRRKLAVSGLSKTHDVDGAKFAIVCTRLLTPSERANAFRFLGRLGKKLSEEFQRLVLIGGDVGVKPVDLTFASDVAPYYIVGQSREYGGVDETGPPTAKGVMEAIELASRMYGKDSLWARTLGVKGLGSVGAALVKEALKRGWDVTIADTNPQKIADLQSSLLRPVRVVESSQVHKEPITVFAPCAIHPIITRASVGEFRCKMIMSAQNTDIKQTEAFDLAIMLHEMGIIWGPGYVNNPGGIAMLLQQKNLATLSYETILNQVIARHKTRAKQIFEEAVKRNVPIFIVAEEMIQAALR